MCCNLFPYASKEAIAIITQELIDKLKTYKTENNTIYIDKEEIMLLFDNKCYDILNNISESGFGIHFTKEEVIKILNDFPFDKFNFHIFEKVIENNIKEYSNELIASDFNSLPISLLIAIAKNFYNRDDEIYKIIDERFKGDLSLFNNPGCVFV